MYQNRTRGDGKHRTLVIGLDCATPELLFERPEWRMQALRALMARGTYGELRTITPAITVPAWACMVTGKDPGELGIYGFRNRTDYTYGGMALTTSLDVKEPTVWDRLGASGDDVIVVGVPPSYPPKTVHGIQVGCFLTPSVASPYTYPPSAKDEISALLRSEYITDCPNFRTEDKDGLRQQLYDMMERRFTVLEDWIEHKPWDFFMFVEIGSDRLHHGFWKFFDPMHRGYVANNRHENVIQRYYEDLDAYIGHLLERIDLESTDVIVVSDHGAKRMDGGVCLNEWLIREGYLVLESQPDRPTAFANLSVDWPKTTAWGEGGYYGRVCFNIAGREPQGRVTPAELPSLADELEKKIGAIPDDRGRPMRTQVFRPERIYRTVRRIAPDMMIYFDDLYWRSVGSVGYGAIHTFENDTGPDDANHAQHGVYIEALAAGRGGRGRSETLDITAMADRLVQAG
jgi:predicted AlkP superfamily phosphohydrolase/phosphomutase